MNGYIIKDSLWFSNIGIVMVEVTITKERKAYIGNGGDLVMKEAERYIAEHGMPITAVALNMVSDFLRNVRVGRVKG